MNEKYVGTVIWFDPKRGFGFIDWEKNGTKQKDLFVHFSDVSCEGFKTLQKNQRITFNLGSNRNNEVKAIEVLVV